MQTPKLKILHVVDSLEPGGMENGVVNMVAALGGSFDFQVACLTRRGRFAERLPNPSLAWELGKTSGFSFRVALRLAQRILQVQPDVIHTHNLGPLIYTSIATLGGAIRPILHGEHAQLTAEECTPRRLRQRRILYQCCRKIHTVCHSQREELFSKGFASIKTVVNGVDVDRFAPGSKELAKESAGIPKEALVMGIVGRFGPFKRHAALLEAFEKISRENPLLHLLIVGAGGPEEAAVKGKAGELESKERIHFTGFQREPAAFYRAMDFLVVPSINEGLSNAVLEAMACGIPILAHLACGNQEVIATGGEGIVTDLGSTEALIAGIQSMLANHANWPFWAESAREKCLRQFSLGGMAQGYAELYRATCEEGR